METYLHLLNDVLTKGEQRSDRTGTGTLSLFGCQMRFDLSQGFPLMTTKKVHVRSLIHELLWFLKGDTNVQYLRDNKVTIWDEWADANGDLGPVYGFQWRHWGKPWRPKGDTEQAPSPSEPTVPAVDQIKEAVELIKNNPHSRRIIVNAWNVGDLKKMALPPCHTMFQFYVHTDGRLSCQLYQRSADFFLGVPFNIASYALFTMMMAHVTGLKPGFFVHTLGDTHLYLNHIEQAKLQLSRPPKPLPRLQLSPSVTSIFDFKYEDFTLTGYDPHPSIPAPISV